MEGMRARYPFWRIEAPMQWVPVWGKEQMIKETEALGIRVPRLYYMGFPHNNCGGRCVAAGITHWVTLYHRDRPAYMEWAEEERITMELFAARGIQQMTMLKDRRGGITQNLSLYDLAKRIESGEKFSQFEWGGCGCGTQYDAAA